MDISNVKSNNYSHQNFSENDPTDTISVLDFNKQSDMLIKSRIGMAFHRDSKQ